MKDGDHVGRRIEHASDLYDIWNEGLEILERTEAAKTVKSTMAQRRIQMLKSALELLDYYLTDNHLSDVYEREINYIGAHPEDIKGGRGTELHYGPPEQKEGEDPFNT